MQNNEANSTKIERLQFGFRLDNWRKYMSLKLSQHICLKVLEVGAGVGCTTKNLFNKEVKEWHSIEPNIDLYNKYLRNQNEGLIPKKVKITNCYLEDLKENSFNTIIYIDVLEHIKDDKKEISLASLKVSNGGKIIILCPAYQFLYSKLDSSIGHYRRYTKRQIFDLFDNKYFELDGFYLDTIGIFANLLNKYIIKSASPSKFQYLIFNNIIIPISKILDKILNYSFGRSVIVVATKK